MRRRQGKVSERAWAHDRICKIMGQQTEGDGKILHVYFHVKQLLLAPSRDKETHSTLNGVDARHVIVVLPFVCVRLFKIHRVKGQLILHVSIKLYQSESVMISSVAMAYTISVTFVFVHFIRIARSLSCGVRVRARTLLAALCTLNVTYYPINKFLPHIIPVFCAKPLLCRRRLRRSSSLPCIVLFGDGTALSASKWKKTIQNLFNCDGKWVRMG